MSMEPKPNTGSRQRAERRGRRAETIAAIFLRLKGYRILATRVRTPVGEIDLIAQRGNTVAFIEVKQRSNIALAQTAVPNRNWQRIANAAANWMAKQSRFSDQDWRYDLIAIAPWKWPVHSTDFWRP